MTSLAYRTRNAEFGEWSALIKAFPLGFTAADDLRPFLQFDNTVVVGLNFERLIGWSHPELMHLTKHAAIPVFIDCTFKCVPKGFSNV